MDFAPTLRSIQATRPDLVFFASYPPDSNGILRAVSELRLSAPMLGGGMIGPQIAAVQAQLGELAGVHAQANTAGGGYFSIAAGPSALASVSLATRRVIWQIVIAGVGQQH